MATIYTDAAAMALPVDVADTTKRTPGVNRTGDVTFREAIYTVPASGAPVTADILRICRIPQNAIVLPHLCKIICTAMGTAMNISKVGDSAIDGETSPTDDPDDDDRYSGTISAITAGGAFDFNYAARPAGLASYINKRSRWLTATFGTVTSPTPGATIRFCIALAVQS